MAGSLKLLVAAGCLCVQLGAAQNATGAPESPCADFSSLNLSEQIVCLDERDGVLQSALDDLWVMVTAIGILSLQTGFTMLEAGTVQSKNVKSVLLKNITDMLFGTLIWWLIGFGIYLGDSTYAAGDPELFVITESKLDLYPNFVQQFGFAVTSVTIVSGAILSRMKFELYIVYSVFFVGVVYPLAAHWAWADNGWLGALGYVDFAGSGVVHYLGGVAGLVGAYLIEPRVGRFYDKDQLDGGTVRPLPPHSTVLIALGGFLLYVGWFSFNAGSSGGLAPEDIPSAKRALINTLLASATGGTIVTLYSLAWKRSHDVPLVVNGLLSGLVAVTGPSGSVDTWAAVLIGGSAGLLFIPISYVVLHKLKIDDPVSAFTVHGFAGAWGVILTAFFDQDVGVFYGGDGSVFGAQLAGLAAMGALSGTYTFLCFFLLKKTVGLRVSVDDQLVGLDVSYHSGYAYPEFDMHQVRVFNAKRIKEKEYRDNSKRNLRDISSRSGRSQRGSFSSAVGIRSRAHGSNKSNRSNISGRTRSESEDSTFEEEVPRKTSKGEKSRDPIKGNDDEEV